MSQKPDPYELEGVKRRAPKPFPWLALFFALTALVLGAVILSPIPEKIRKKVGISSPQKGTAPAPPPEPQVIIKEKVVEKVVKVRPAYYEVKSGTDVSKTSMGFDYKSRVEERPGRLASTERENDGTYEASFTLTIKRPEPAKHFDEVVSVNPELPKILPGLEKLMDQAKISPFYRKLYDNKVSRLKTYVNRIDRLLTKHNYYDCQTMLELEYPGTNRKVFLMQGDMDVVSDGSDGDRLATMPDKIVNSPHYQPFTSYGWAKTGNIENPMIAGWRRLLEKAKASGNASEVKRLETGIADLKRRSFLIADYDPFIVISVDVLRDRESPYGPNVGDYVLVIHGKDIYPAIVGDGGPTFKVGEASLRMAKQINAKASSYSRPVSDLSVTYIVFPRSSGKWVAPNYDDWRNECLKLVNEIGGLGEGYELHRWENTLPVIEEEATELPE
jgi:hypothetical protein